MKKIIVLFLSVCMLFSLVACGNQDNAAGADARETTQEGAKNASSQEAEDSAKDDASGSGENTGVGKTMVVYFSATGNTKEVADYIAAETGADMLELQPVDAFIAANDFTGKTVIPFCTSSTSGLGESGELLEEAAGTGNWLEGMRFSSNASKETVQSWLDGLGVS